MVVAESSTSFAGVKARKSPLPGGRYHCVILYGIRVPIAVRLFAKCYAAVYFTCCILLFLHTHAHMPTHWFNGHFPREAVYLVQVTPLGRPLVSSPNSECSSYLHLRHAVSET